jgi:plasmid replication initiation protein
MEQLEQNTDLMIRKSNTLISGKFKTSILENKIMAIALTRIEIKDGCPVARLYPGEIKQLLGKNTDTNIYKKLKRTAKLMTGHQIVIEDSKGNFSIFTMVNNADYVDKQFIITFNKNMTPFVHQLKNNFTTYEVATLMKIEKAHSYRLYELLKKEIYRSDPNINNGVVTKEYGLSELKCTIGLANTDEAGVQRAIADGKSWDEIYYNVVKDKSFEVWYEFRRQVLDVAQKELAEKSDIVFEYEPLKYGSGAKVRRIRFYIAKNEPSKTKPEMDRMVDLIHTMNEEQVASDTDNDGVYSYIGHNKLTRDDIIEFMRVAEEDEEKVENAIKLADKQDYLKNYVGWIISCIKGKYEQPTEVIQGSSEKADTVNNLKTEIDNNEADIAERIWSKIKNKEDYIEFIAYLNSKGIKENTLDVVYDTNERIDLYTNWKTKRKL